MVKLMHGEFVYVGDAKRDGNVFTIPAEEAHHLMRVRRRRVGQEVYATDGSGNVYRSLIESPESIRVIETLANLGESSLKVTLVCGCLQGDSSREVVNAAVQLGVCDLIWVRMMHSQEVYTENKLERLRRVAIQALKQTGRARLTRQAQHESLQESLEAVSGQQVWVAQPASSPDSVPQSVPSSPCALVVGPEGGFAEQEIELLDRFGARYLTLGPRRLRTETAVSAGLAFLLTRSEEFRC